MIWLSDMSIGTSELGETQASQYLRQKTAQQDWSRSIKISDGIYYLGQSLHNI
jgi:hypothetical protein